MAALLITLLAAAFLTTAEYGVYTLAVVFAEFVVMLTYTGYFHFVVNSDEEDDAVLSSMFWVMTGIGSVGGLVIFLASGALARAFEAPDLGPVLRAFGLLQPFAAMIGWATAALTRAGRMRQYYLAIGGANLGALAVGAALLVTWQSVFALVAFRAARVTLALLLYGRALPRLPRAHVNWRIVRKATRYASSLYGSSLLTFFANFGTDLVLAGLFSTAESGLYRFANRLAQASVELVAQPMHSFALRSFGVAARGGRPLGPVLAEYLGAGTLFLGGVAATLIVLGGPAVGMLFHPDYAAGIVVMQLLALRAGARVGQLLGQPVLAASNRTALALQFNLGFSGAMLLVIGLFAPLGLVPLASAQAVVQLLSVPALLWLLQARAGIETGPALRPMGRALALVALYAALLAGLWAATGLTGLGGAGRLALCVLLAAGLGALLAALAIRARVFDPAILSD